MAPTWAPQRLLFFFPSSTYVAPPPPARGPSQGLSEAPNLLPAPSPALSPRWSELCAEVGSRHSPQTHCLRCFSPNTGQCGYSTLKPLKEEPSNPRLKPAWGRHCLSLPSWGSREGDRQSRGHRSLGDLPAETQGRPSPGASSSSWGTNRGGGGETGREAQRHPQRAHSCHRRTKDRGP